MPYIKQNIRNELEDAFAEALTPFEFGGCVLGAGNLNYVVTRMISGYINKRGLSYSTLNEVVGVLECVKAELQRRVVANYEDKKRSENGEVYLTS